MASEVLAKAPSQTLGPEYREKKPIATVSTEVGFDNVHVLNQTPQLIALLTCVHISALLSRLKTKWLIMT
jgi:hypothetical protein